MSKLTRRCLTTLSSLALFTACTAANSNHEDGERPPPEQTTAADEGPKPETVSSTKVTVASVQMIQDCPTVVGLAPGSQPDSAATKVLAAPAAMPPAQSSPARRAKGGAGAAGHGFHQPCTQSTVQLGLETTSEVPVSVEIRAVRLIAGGEVLTTLETREPTAWRANSYIPWDQRIEPNEPVKASYKLSLPDDWTGIETTIGAPSFGFMFTLDIDVAVDGVVQTVSSPEFPREQPHVVVT